MILHGVDDGFLRVLGIDECFLEVNVEVKSGLLYIIVNFLLMRTLYLSAIYAERNSKSRICKPQPRRLI